MEDPSCSTHPEMKNNIDLVVNQETSGGGGMEIMIVFGDHIMYDQLFTEPGVEGGTTILFPHMPVVFNWKGVNTFAHRNNSIGVFESDNVTS